MDPRKPAADAIDATDDKAGVKGDAAWLRWVALLNGVLIQRRRQGQVTR